MPLLLGTGIFVEITNAAAFVMVTKAVCARTESIGDTRLIRAKTRAANLNGRRLLPRMNFIIVNAAFVINKISSLRVLCFITTTSNQKGRSGNLLVTIVTLQRQVGVGRFHVRILHSATINSSLVKERNLDLIKRSDFKGLVAPLIQEQFGVHLRNDLVLDERGGVRGWNNVRLQTGPT